MIIRTDSDETIKEDINMLLYQKEIEVITTVEKTFIDNNLGKKNITDRHYEIVDSIIDNHLNVEFISEVYLYHLSRQLQEPNHLYPLNRLLVEENEMTNFLKKYDIKFLKGEDSKIELYYKNEHINIKHNKYNGEWYYLFNRLEKDFCINGFTFLEDIQNNQSMYYNNLERSPEIIRDLEKFFNIKLQNEYYERSKFYCCVIKVPIEEIIFDGCTELKSKSDKARYLINRAIMHVLGKSDNPIIRLSDNKSVKVDRIICYSN